MYRNTVEISIPNKRGNLYCENPKYLRHFEKLECKIPVTFIGLFKELGVLNFKKPEEGHFFLLLEKEENNTKSAILWPEKCMSRKQACNLGIQFDYLRALNDEEY